MLTPHHTQTRNWKPLQTYNHSLQMSLFSDGLFYDSHKLVKGSTNFCPVFRNLKIKIFLEQKPTQHIFLSRHFTPFIPPQTATDTLWCPSWLPFPLSFPLLPAPPAPSLLLPRLFLFTYLLFWGGTVVLLMFIFTRWAQQILWLYSVLQDYRCVPPHLVQLCY